MFKPKGLRTLSGLNKFKRSAISLTLIFLLIEFFDELHYGIDSAVLPALRSDLALSYAQVGLLLGLPQVIGTLVEPVLMLLGDTGLRKRLVIGGGLAIASALVIISVSRTFNPLLLAFIVNFPASGAFVSLSQATLMDINPGREPHTMARWTVAGSLGNLLGPLLLAAGFTLAFGWRWAYLTLAMMVSLLIILVLPRRLPAHPAAKNRREPRRRIHPKELIKNLWEALRNRRLLRWIILLQFSDLLLDMFTGYLALYFTDIAGATPAQASLLLGLLMITGLTTDLLLIPLLEHVPGRRLVRLSAILAAVIYSAWLLAPWLVVKVFLLILIRLSTIGWYQVLQGEAYASVPGRSGTVMAVGSIGGLLGGALAWLIGWAASWAGLPTAMWLLLLGPLAVALFVPGAQSELRPKTAEQIPRDRGRIYDA